MKIIKKYLESKPNSDNDSFLENIAKKYNKKEDPNIIIENIECRLKNLSEQIFKLQMQQFAESIKRIQYIKNHNLYLISFDEDTQYTSVILDEVTYKGLLSYRYSSNCNPITDAFISDDISTFFDFNRINNEIQNGAQKYLKNNHQKIEKIFIGKFLLPQYNFCHQCKLAKPDNELVHCLNNEINYTYSNINKKNHSNHKESSNQINMPVYLINKSIVLKKEKIFLIQNYEGNIRELIDEYFIDKRKDNIICNKYYCKSCLKMIYNMNPDKDLEKKFICPCCNNQCSCSRCLRHTQLIYIISSYITLNGNLNILYNSMKEKNKIIVILKDFLVMSNFVILSVIDKSKRPIYQNINFIKRTIEFKNYLESCQYNWINFFSKALNNKKCLSNNIQYIDNQKDDVSIIDEIIDSRGKCWNKISFLNKKRRYQKSKNKIKCLSENKNIEHISTNIKKKKKPSKKINSEDNKKKNNLESYYIKHGIINKKENDQIFKINCKNIKYNKIYKTKLRELKKVIYKE